jgi:hypothetical protein
MNAWKMTTASEVRTNSRNAFWDSSVSLGICHSFRFLSLDEIEVDQTLGRLQFRHLALVDGVSRSDDLGEANFGTMQGSQVEPASPSTISLTTAFSTAAARTTSSTMSWSIWTSLVVCSTTPDSG